jgi:VanZ family protein
VTTLAPLLRTAFWLLLALITLLALVPKPPEALSLGWDKLNHLGAFFALGLLARLAWPAQAWRRWFLGLMAYGLLLELAQGMVPGRAAEAADLLTDAAGLAAAALLARAWQRWQQAR